MSSFRRPKYLIMVLIAALVVCVGGYFGYEYYVSAKSTTTSETRFYMDTFVTISATGANSSEIVEQAFNEIKRVEELFSRFLPASDVYKINVNAGKWVGVSPEVIEVIEIGLKISGITNGAFDVTIGSLVTLWGFGTGDYRVPSEEELEQALLKIDYNKIQINKKTNEVFIPEGFVIDLGGVAKGYAVDRATGVLKTNGIKHGMVNAGGDIVTIGPKVDGSLWRVGVQDPINTTEILLVIPMKDSAIVTSGDYQRFFIEDNVRYHHIIDPRTGYPAKGLTSVTVVAPSATEADLYSTAIFVLGLDKGKELVESLKEIEAVIVDTNGQVWISSGLIDSVYYL
ncbi:MAG: FAD:protein FMN transferase [Firmicutes bacterium]|nr:FAD:protein FMN transferase [Bacillota bacterium]